MSWEHFLVPESKELLKKLQGHSLKLKGIHGFSAYQDREKLESEYKKLVLDEIKKKSKE